MAAEVLSRVDAAFAVVSVQTNAAAKERGDEEDAETPSLQTTIDRFIDREILANQRKPTCWSKLDVWLKWQRVKEYLVEQGVRENSVVMQEIRSMLAGGTLTGVEYDAQSQKVTRLNVFSL
jgi:hypothetical protein